MDRHIASRPSVDQTVAIVNFMEKHPALALGQLRGLEGREESKKLWMLLTKIVNGMEGPTRPMKSWVKYWADKKSTVRSKVQAVGGDPNCLCSNIEKKIYDLFLCHEPVASKQRTSSVKEEVQMIEDNFFADDGMDQSHAEVEPEISFEEPPLDAEERQIAILDKLLKVTSEQATAMTQLAHAAVANSQAMERLAEASHIQARALERLAGALEAARSGAGGVRSAVVDIDASLKRLYSAPPS